MSTYPPHIADILRAPPNIGEADNANGSGTGASFICGSFIRFSLRVDSDTKRIEAVRFRSNGCGSMVAAAQVIAETIEGMRLSSLNGSSDGQLGAIIQRLSGEGNSGREHCFAACLDSLRAAFLDHRNRTLSDYTGEKAIVCTCFNVSGETIEKLITDSAALSVEKVGDLCRAGNGCGSCRMLIQEMLDER